MQGMIRNSNHYVTSRVCESTALQGLRVGVGPRHPFPICRRVSASSHEEAQPVLARRGYLRIAADLNRAWTPCTCIRPHMQDATEVQNITRTHLGELGTVSPGVRIAFGIHGRWAFGSTAGSVPDLARPMGIPVISAVVGVAGMGETIVDAVEDSAGVRTCPWPSHVFLAANEPRLIRSLDRTQIAYGIEGARIVA